ncbi:MAG: hypothetical protein Ta2B_10900 [Termitinemataceae bacterium]|nr:MAG: hypothetical protein Ta2B_10900 [Termitinemataceae bacterium]
MDEPIIVETEEELETLKKYGKKAILKKDADILNKYNVGSDVSPDTPQNAPEGSANKPKINGGLLFGGCVVFLLGLLWWPLFIIGAIVALFSAKSIFQSI